MDFPTEQTRVALVKRLMKAVGDVRRARTLTDLGLALVQLDIAVDDTAKAYQVMGCLIYEAQPPKTKAEVISILLDYNIVKQQALAKFPKSRSKYGYGNIQKLIKENAIYFHSGFTVDMLRKESKGLKQVPRQTLQIILHDLAKKGILQLVTAGEIGRNGTPAKWRVKDNKIA